MTETEKLLDSNNCTNHGKKLNQLYQDFLKCNSENIRLKELNSKLKRDFNSKPVKL